MPKKQRKKLINDQSSDKGAVSLRKDFLHHFLQSLKDFDKLYKKLAK